MGMPRLCLALAERHADACLYSSELQELARSRIQEALRSCREAMAHEGPPEAGAILLDPEILWSSLKSGSSQDAQSLMDQAGPMRLCGFVIRSAMLSTLRKLASDEAKIQAWAEMSSGPGAGMSADAGKFNLMLHQAAQRISELEAKVAMMAAPRRTLLGQGKDDGGASPRPAPLAPRR